MRLDLGLPLRSLSPGVDADVLRVLVETHAPLTGNRVATLAQRSYAQVRAVLHRLVDAGVVGAERHGRAVSYTLNRGHVLVPPLELIARAHEEIEARIAQQVTTWSRQPVCVAVFGSFARRDGDHASDIDLLLVRPDDLEVDDQGWSDDRYGLTEVIERSTGNPTQVLDLSASELRAATEADAPLVTSLRREARTVYGYDLRALLTNGNG